MDGIQLVLIGFILAALVIYLKEQIQYLIDKYKSCKKPNESNINLFGGRRPRKRSNQLYDLEKAKIHRKFSDRYWIFKQLSEEWLLDNRFDYNDINGDSGFYEIKYSGGKFKIVFGEDGFSYGWKTSIKTIHDLLELYKDETGECLTIYKY